MSNLDQTPVASLRINPNTGEIVRKPNFSNGLQIGGTNLTNQEGVLKWNGSPIGSGGNPFDQSLNTGDNVEFNELFLGGSRLTNIVPDGSGGLNINTLNGGLSITDNGTLMPSGDLFVGAANVRTNGSADFAYEAVTIDIYGNLTALSLTVAFGATLFSQDGSATLANNNAGWDASGNATFTSLSTLQKGQVTLDNTGSAIVTDCSLVTPSSVIVLTQVGTSAQNTGTGESKTLPSVVTLTSPINSFQIRGDTSHASETYNWMILC